MALIDEMKLRRSKLEETLDEIVKAIEEQEDLRLRVERELDDFDRAITALKPPPAAVTEPEPEPEPQDDASEFAEEGYAPVIEPEPSALTTWGQHEELRAAGFVPVGAPDDDGPVAAFGRATMKWERRGAVTEPEPTKPEADALAKAADYYSPEAVAERNKFNPFAMFRKEGDQ